MLLSTARALVDPYWRAYFEPSDIVQNTLLEAHQHASRLEGLEEGSVVAWLRRALKHTILDSIKHLKTKRRDVRRTLHVSDLGPSRDQVGYPFMAADTSPSQIAQRNEQFLLLFEAMEKLPENQRIAIIMKHLEGRSLKEIAEALELTESAIAGLLHRGRQNLMRQMDLEETDA